MRKTECRFLDDKINIQTTVLYNLDIFFTNFTNFGNYNHQVTVVSGVVVCEMWAHTYMVSDVVTLLIRDTLTPQAYLSHLD